MLKEMEGKLGLVQEDLCVVKKYIPSTDRVTNKEYCKMRGITRRCLDKWFAKGCPREDNRHVSTSKVDKWAAENNTRQVKKQG